MISKESRNDKDIVLKYVKKNSHNLKFISVELRNDEDVIFASINDICEECFNYASNRLKNNKDFILKAVKKNSHIIKYINEELKKDREILLEAVKYKGTVLEFIPKEFQNDREIVLTAVQNIGIALHYASEELKNDIEILLTAIKNNEVMFYYFSTKFKKDRKFVLESVKLNGLVLQFVSEKLQNDKEIVFQAVNNNGLALQFASEELINDYYIVLQAVKNRGKSLKYASEKLKNNIYIVLQAIKYEGYALKYASEELRNNFIIVFEATKNKSEAYKKMILEYTSKELQKKYNSFLLFIKDKMNIFYNINIKYLLYFIDNKIFLEYDYKELTKYKTYIPVIEFFKLIDNCIYEDYLIKKYQHFLHLIDNKTNLCKYLLDNNKYEIIYNNEEIHEYIKINFNIIILCLNDFDIDNDYNTDVEQLKESVYKKIFNEKITVIFIKFDEKFNIIFLHIEECKCKKIKNDIVNDDNILNDDDNILNEYDDIHLVKNKLKFTNFIY
jgi:hypothetical protein